MRTHEDGAGKGAGRPTRRDLLEMGGRVMTAALPLGLAGGWRALAVGAGTSPGNELSSPAGDGVRLFLAGDVMTGRGIDQVLAHSVDPRLHEPWVQDARTYVELAEKASGPIPATVDERWVWGEVLDVLEAFRPQLRLVNLETAVTAAGEPWPGKGIHYRMHPGNVGVLTAAGLDCCALANNHVLDWGRPGLADTLGALAAAGIRHPGAGATLEQAAAPAALPLAGGGRVLVLSLGHPSSGIPPAWAATAERSGVWLDDLSEETTTMLAASMAAARAPGDLVVASIHWGGNWGYEVPRAHRRFAHRLVEEAGVDVVHGHSSHHPIGIEVHRERLILYGCGDLINDYEGISGHEDYRGELRLMYLPRFDAGSGRLLGLEMVVLVSDRFRLRRAAPADARWLAARLDRSSRPLGSQVELRPDGTLALSW